MLLSDIGEGSNALYCLTDRELCCSTEAGDSRGWWQYSGGDVQNNTNADIYTSRGFSSIHLNNRMSTMAMRPAVGVYECHIPDARDNVGILRITTVVDSKSVIKYVNVE